MAAEQIIWYICVNELYKKRFVEEVGHNNKK